MPPRRNTATEALPAPDGSLLDGNGRVARLARWLRDPPKRKEVDVLVLEQKTDEGWIRVKSWDRSDVNTHLALAIDAAVVDLANEVGAYVTAKVAWFDTKASTYWMEHALRAQPEGMGTQQAFSGDPQSGAIQTQRALERLIGQYMGGIETSQRMCERAADIAHSNYESRELELMTLRERCAALESENSDLQMQLERALSEGERIASEAEQQATGTSQQQQAIGIFQNLLTGKAATS